MRLPIESFAGRIRCQAFALILVPMLASCASPAQLASASAASRNPTGPAADYPVVIGSPYKIGDTLYTPADAMNYDEVGYAAADEGSGITASNHTLPLPSYAEVTSLKTGHTILVRVERRGPMSGDQLVGLSQAALAQLGASAGDPVRLRRVNPLEAERAALRAGRSAPARMDTPASLVAVLKRKLPAEGSANLAREKPRIAPAALAVASPDPSEAPTGSGTAPSPSPSPVLATTPQATAAPRPLAVVRARQTPVPSTGAKAPSADQKTNATSAVADRPYMVQAATMSTLERAQKVAGSIGGSIAKAGQYFRVRTGPFATRDQAQASLAKVRAAGYTDARIFTNG